MIRLNTNSVMTFARVYSGFILAIMLVEASAGGGVRRLGSDLDSAIADIGTYPGMVADQVSGLVETVDLKGGGITFSGEIYFPDETYLTMTGGVHVHAGTTCDNPAEVYFHLCPWRGPNPLNADDTEAGPYSCVTSPTDLTDPWDTLYTVVSDGKGGGTATFSVTILGEVDEGKPYFNVDSKPALYSVVDHAVVIHAPLAEAPFGGGVRIGCGILETDRRRV